MVALHVNKGERLAISQLKSILQAAIHGEEKLGKERLEKWLGKKVSFRAGKMPTVQQGHVGTDNASSAHPQAKEGRLHL